MFFTIFINGALGFATYIIILYCFGNVEKTLGSTYGFPFIQIFYNATQSKAGTTAMTSVLIAMYVFATFGFVAAASRQAWAFARDNGLPFSNLFKKVRLVTNFNCVYPDPSSSLSSGPFSRTQPNQNPTNLPNPCRSTPASRSRCGRSR